MSDHQVVVPEGDDEFLSEHTISMRRALRYCQSLELPLSVDLDESERCNANQETVQSLRADAARLFWSHQPNPTMEYVDASAVSPEDFRSSFHRKNIPCVIRGLDQTFFKSLVEKWRKPDGSVNREWFLENLGAERVVPVRVQPKAPASLDEDGRAEECQTQNMPLKEWVSIIEVDNSSSASSSSLYLKDWHLQLLVEDIGSDQLYDCPHHLNFDLLNNLQRNFTRGDYRFCYWGAANSYTPRHSDVLHSFSWSFNVVGTKKWTFYSPLHDDQRIQVIQRSGECMFVPSEWQHDVVNLEETISVNHNWITPANVDRTMECLRADMAAVEKEMHSWGIEQCWNSLESMLRGTSGLDITALFTMICLGLLKLLCQDQDCQELDSPSDSEPPSSWEIFRLSNALEILLEDESINLASRLQATLDSDSLGRQGIGLARRVLALVSQSSESCNG